MLIYQSWQKRPQIERIHRLSLLTHLGAPATMEADDTLLCECEEFSYSHPQKSTVIGTSSSISRPLATQNRCVTKNLYLRENGRDFVVKSNASMSNESRYPWETSIFAIMENLIVAISTNDIEREEAEIPAKQCSRPSIAAGDLPLRRPGELRVVLGGAMFAMLWTEIWAAK